MRQYETRVFAQWILHVRQFVREEHRSGMEFDGGLGMGFHVGSFFSVLEPCIATVAEMLIGDSVESHQETAVIRDHRGEVNEI